MQVFSSHIRRMFSVCFIVLCFSTVAGVAQAQLPDVVVVDINPIPADPVAGESTDIFVRIRNIGSVSTPQNVPVGVGVQVDGSHVGSFFMRDINGNGPTRSLPAGNPYYWKITTPWTATAGTHQICAFVDDVDRFLESNENNNSSCISLTVPPSTNLPDVVVNDIDLGGIPSLPPGIQARFRVFFENIGSASTPPGVPVGGGIRVNGVFIGSFFARNGLGQIISLSGGQNSSGDVFWTTVPGTHQVCAYIDDIDRFAESNENNNSRCETLQVDAQVAPDVIVEALAAIPSQPTAGQSVRIDALTSNVGNGATPNGVAVGTGFQVDGAFAGSSIHRVGGNIAPLQPGLFSFGTIYWTATSGSHQICAIADDIDRFVESNENNNTTCITVNVP